MRYFVVILMLFAFFNNDYLFAAKDKDCHCGKNPPQEENASGENK